MEEGTSYGTVAFKVRGKLLARMKEDGETLVLRIDMDERELLLRADPKVFFITDHYRGFPAVLIRLPAITRDALEDVLERAWAFVAPPKLVKAREADG